MYNGVFGSSPVIELRIYLQNIRDCSICFEISNSHAYSSTNILESFDILSEENGCNVAPKLLNINERLVREYQTPQEVFLGPLDVAGYALFLRCKDCQTEEDFLQRSGDVFMTIKLF